MSKPNVILKRATNALLDLIGGGTGFPASESELARMLDVSRTTVHAALQQIIDLGIVSGSGRKMTVLRPPEIDDYFTNTQTTSPRDMVEQVFMEWMMRGDWSPGQEFSETDLARDSGASTASVREFLIAFSRFHLIEKRSRGGWRMLGLHIDSGNEVAEMRRLIELEAIGRIVPAPGESWRQTIETFRRKHLALQADIENRYLDFAGLDREFHLWMVAHLNNRFANDFFDIVSFVFHYHYQWNRFDEKTRNQIAIAEHLGILAALAERDMQLATQRLAAHLATSRANLLRSLRPAELPGGHGKAQNRATRTSGRRGD